MNSAPISVRCLHKNNTQAARASSRKYAKSVTSEHRKAEHVSKDVRCTDQDNPSNVSVTINKENMWWKKA